MLTSAQQELKHGTPGWQREAERLVFGELSLVLRRMLGSSGLARFMAGRFHSCRGTLVGFPCSGLRSRHRPASRIRSLSASGDQTASGDASPVAGSTR